SRRSSTYSPKWTASLPSDGARLPSRVSIITDRGILPDYPPPARFNKLARWSADGGQRGTVDRAAASYGRAALSAYKGAGGARQLLDGRPPQTVGFCPAAAMRPHVKR